MPFDLLEPCITFDIFLRLPLKCIGRSRCVSTSLRDSLSDPIFIRMHLDQSKHMVNDHNLNLVVRNYSNLYSLPLSACKDKLQEDLSHYQNKLLEVVDLYHPFKPTKTKPVPDIIVGSCDGIFCIKCFSMKTVCLWNPCTREYKSLPASFTEYQASNTWFDWIELGFGYNPTTKDYVVVKIDSTPNNYSIIDVYSLSKNSHRRIQHTPYSINMRRHIGELVNGAIYWFASHPITKKQDLLVAFDIGTETLREVSQPDYVCKNFHTMTVVEFTGQLCICLYYPGWLDTWVMKDCGVKESWTKLLKIARNPVYYYAQSGWFLLLLNDKLTLFNPEDGACNQLEVKGIDQVHNVLCYTHGMVKLNGIIHTDKHLMVSPSTATEGRRNVSNQAIM